MKFVQRTECPLEIGSPFHPNPPRGWLIDLSMIHLADLGSELFELSPCRSVSELWG